ncbi:MAG: sulfotransferase, partial [Thermoanaerobaculia bacterium]
GIPVVDHPAALETMPDVIHGHHHLETMTALLQCPGVPAVFFSHDAVSWHDIAPSFPRILRYVAVDEANRERLASETGVREDRIRVVLNFVDLTRFRPRGPLPPRPRRALVFSNNANEGTFLQPVRKACARTGLALDVFGAGVGRSVARPEDLLGEYDLVFAKARCALEAMAVGAAVVLCDAPGMGPMVAMGDFELLRRFNFGGRVLREPIQEERLVAAIQRYDARDAAEVSRRVRATAGMESALDQLIAVYTEAVEEARRTEQWDPDAENRAAAAYLRRWGARLRDRAELARFRDELARIQGSATWRARSRLLRVPGVAGLYRAVSRLAGRPPRKEGRGEPELPLLPPTRDAAGAPAPFLVGAGRSGTTLLRLMLDAHPDLAIPPETDFWVEAASACARAADPRQAFLTVLLSHWRWTDCHVDSVAFQRAINEMEPFDLTRGIRCFYRLYAARFGKARWGDKTPFYLGHMVLIQKLVPEARFVHVLRDGRDVALSIKDLWFGPNSLDEAAVWWTSTVAEARRQKDHLSHYLEIRYEDLVLDTQKTLRKVCEFLDLPWDPAMLSFHRRSAERIGEVVREFRDAGDRLIASVEQRHAIHRRALGPPDPSRIGRWRTEMTEREKRRFHRAAGDLLEALGYEEG